MRDLLALEKEKNYFTCCSDSVSPSLLLALQLAPWTPSAHWVDLASILACQLYNFRDILLCLGVQLARSSLLACQLDLVRV